MALYLVAVPDVILPDGTVRRGVLPEPAESFDLTVSQALAQVRVRINMGILTISEARTLMGL